ncbi:hypothetical protein pb186bvf_019018 [Paramecium bursaria]
MPQIIQKNNFLDMKRFITYITEINILQLKSYNLIKISLKYK